jgi:ERCC4-type nuclease
MESHGGDPPNKLFISYLSKLREKSLNRKDGRAVVLYDKALESLRRYPLPLRSVKEALKLKNIGQRVAADLEACMAKYGGGPAPVAAAPPPKPRKRQAADTTPSEGGKKQKASAAVVVIEDVDVEEEPQKEAYEWRAGDEVVLVVDHRELARKRGAKLRQELERLGVRMESAALALADMAWIVRDGRGGVWMLRHAVERKTVSDLSASIKDGRYREQKFRLAQAGLARVAYLVEGSLTPNTKYQQKAAHSLLPAATLEAAVASTAYGGSSFLVQRCRDVAHTAHWLLMYTQQLQALLLRPAARAELLFGCSLAAFNARNQKELNPSVSDVFAKQLLAVQGVSCKKVVPLVNRYPTMAHLWQAYEECEGKTERRKLLQNVALSENRTLGPVASTTIAKMVFEV